MGKVETYTLDDMRAVVEGYSRQQGRAPQVGVMGSAADLGYSDKVASYANEIGQILGQTGATVIFGAEKDCDSLSTTVARAAKAAGGFTIGVTYGNGKDIFDPTAASAVVSMLGERGGPREAVVSRGACDGIISIGGGSGTLNELVAAYQTGGLPIIPLVGMVGTGGNTEKFLGQKFDTRKERAILEPANSPNEAVGLILRRILEIQTTGKPKYPTEEMRILFEEGDLGNSVSATVLSQRSTFEARGCLKQIEIIEDQARTLGIKITTFLGRYFGSPELSIYAFGIKGGQQYQYMLDPDKTSSWLKLS